MAKDLKFEDVSVGEAGGINAKMSLVGTVIKVGTATDAFSIGGMIVFDSPKHGVALDTHHAAQVADDYGTVTRVVGDDLIYVVTDGKSPFVFTPDKICGYKGEHLKQIGIRAGRKVRVMTDRTGRTMLSTTLTDFENT